MSDKSLIEWTDATWNPITGCSVVSPGCTNCYAMRLAGTRLKHHPTREGLTIESKAGPIWNGQVRFNERALSDPLRWSRPRRIFVCAHGDLFAEQLSDAWIDRVFAVMALCPQHVFQVLTKRPARMRAYIDGDRSGLIDLAADIVGDRRGDVAGRVAAENVEGRGWPLPNVWLGTSVEDQRRADERIPELLATPAAVRFVSAEPLLGPVDLESAWSGENALDAECWGDCSWCKMGLPPLHNCRRGADGSKYLDVDPRAFLAGTSPMTMFEIGKKAAGRLLDGVEHNAMPEVP